jgi:hypothetical protein
MKKEKPKNERKADQEPLISFPIAYSVRTWAERYIDLSERTLWEDVKNGQIDVVECGRRRLITASAMAAYLEKRTRIGFDAEAEASKILSSGTAQKR